MILLSSCGKYPVATSFSEKPVDNSFNNFLSGGNIASLKDAVYLNYNTGEVTYDGLYKLTDDKIENVYSDSGNTNYALTAPKLYQYAESMYAVKKNDETVYEFNDKSCEFTKSNFTQKVSNFPVYLSDDLVVYFSDGDRVSVKYKDLEEYTIDMEIVDFYVEKTTLFFLNHYGWVYSLDLTSPQSKYNIVTDKSEGSYGNIFSVCKDYIYYDTSHDSTEKELDGFYRYDIKSDESTLVTDKDVLGINQIDGQVFFSCSDGVYKDNSSGSPEKLTSLKAEELYIVDSKWLYLYNNNGKIYRITFDGKTAEAVNIK